MITLHSAPGDDELEWMSRNSMWIDFKRYSPAYMRLAEQNIQPLFTQGMDDVECFIAWLDYMVENKITGFHISSTKYLSPVEQARAMLEFYWRKNE